MTAERPISQIDLAPADLAGDDPVRKALAIIEDFEDGTPTLAYLGKCVGLSPSHLQRVFKKATGVSPRAYAEARRLERLKTELKGGASVTTALYDAGFNAPSRLYEHANARLGMTPASFAKGGRGAKIRYAIADCALGRMVVAATAHGLCMVGFADDDATLVAELGNEYPAAEISAARPDNAEMVHYADVVAALVDGESGADMPDAYDLPLDVALTVFQARVWDYLRAIPRGETRTYGAIAADLGQPQGARAVARACATNPVAVVIPCHRVIGSDGALHGYRWGMARKERLLSREGAPPRD